MSKIDLYIRKAMSSPDWRPGNPTRGHLKGPGKAFIEKCRGRF